MDKPGVPISILETVLGLLIYNFASSGLSIWFTVGITSPFVLLFIGILWASIVTILQKRRSKKDQEIEDEKN